MSSTNASSSKSTNPNSLKLDDQTRDQQPQQSQLSGLEEDDEFEEFEVQDWDDSQTLMAHRGDAEPGTVKSSGDRLWEDNWDDDDIEDQFMVQLRSELAKTGQGTTGVAPVGAGSVATPEPMQH